MKIVTVALAVFMVGSSGLLGAQSAANPRSDMAAPSAPASLAEDSPAAQRINAAKVQIKANPRKVQAFNDLAIGYMRRVRETADPTFYTEAEQALSQGLRLEPTNFQLQKTEIALLLGRHEYAQARQKAALLNRRTPDDVMIYGYLAEADIALGDYAEAEKSAQWMLNMLPNNVPGLLLGARLRTLYGDAEGSMELLNLAYTETSPTEVEDLAWIANQLASVQIDAGKSDAAIPILDRAEQVFPNYPYTKENYARVRLAQNRPDDAVKLLVEARQLDRDPHVLYELAEAQGEAGHAAEASATYELFQDAVTKQVSLSNKAYVDLILLDTKKAATVTAALALAEHDIALRHDVWTLDAYAWALYANGRIAEAEVQVQKALAVGIQSPQIFNHAGRIDQALKKDESAGKYLNLSIQANPSSFYASDSRKALGLPASEGRAQAPVAGALPAAPASQTAKPLIALAPSSPLPGASQTPHSGDEFAPVPAALLTPQITDTDRMVHTAQANVVRSPKDSMTYAGLGAAYFQRARETGDVNDYQLAEQSLTKSLDLVSGDFAADAPLSTMAEVCMGEHRFSEALTYSQKALALGSGDVSSFAIVGDAYADMGEYGKAGSAYARLTPPEMTLSPRAAYARDSRLSYLKFISGDTAGAISLMQTSAAEGVEAQLPAENLAWLYYELGEYFTQAGDISSADKAYLAALTIHPGDYRALAGLGRLRGNQGRYAEAIALYQKAIAIVPMPIFIAELGDLYARSRNLIEAKKQYQLVEYIGLLGHINQVLHNRDLAIFYADHDVKLPEALSLAQKEFEVRHDIYTWDALAWALYKNDRYAEAKKASDQALQFGTQDALLLFHAGMIAEKLGQRDKARDHLKQALRINPHFHAIYGDVAQRQLTLLDAQAAAH